MVIPELERCQSEYSIVFQLMFYVIKGLLMVSFNTGMTRVMNP